MAAINNIILENPIRIIFDETIKSSKNKVNIAVPFISEYGREFLKEEILNKINAKRLITRFDENNLNSFNLPVLLYVLRCGFEIRFDNSIHLKLYIFDDVAFVSSGNLTGGGFEKNVELTVKINQNESVQCQKIFDELWLKNENNSITAEKIKENWSKYILLKSREKANTNRKIKITQQSIILGSLKIDELVSKIFYENNDYSKTIETAFKANEIRKKRIKDLEKKYDVSLFYAKPNDLNRKECLFYDFVYGYEAGLAGTGLYEQQFKKVFEHTDFINIIKYIYPIIDNQPPWNLSDEKILQEFCNGIFEFKIPEYSEALPIRLASYFYPDFFIPIFKINHLEKVCDALGIQTNAESKGEKLYVFNKLILEKMKPIPYDNYIKSRMAYKLLYTVELHTRLKSNESFKEIKESYNKEWIRNYIDSGKKTLIELKIIK